MEMLSAPFSKPRIRVSFSPSKSQFYLIHFALIVTVFISKSTSIPRDFSEIPYSQYCNDVVQESPSTETQLSPDNFLRLDKAVYSLGFQNPQFEFNPSSPQIASLSARKVYKTESNGVIMVNAFLNLVGPGIVDYFSGNITRRRLRLVRVRPPRFEPRRNIGTGFMLFGFWDSGSGKLCMVGSGVVSSIRSVNVILKLNYPNSSVIDTSLINGTLQSIMPGGSVTYFKPVSILGISRMGYNYSYIDREIKNGGFRVYDGMENASLSLPDSHTVYGRGICSIITWGLRFELDYHDFDCDNVSCNFVTVGEEIFPRFMSIKVVDCLEDGKVRCILQFSNSSYSKALPFYPRTSLVAEGAWDEKKKRLTLIACQLFDEMSSRLIGDCAIRLTFRLPSTLTLKHRSTIIGKMWRAKSVNDSLTFGEVSLRSPRNMNSRIKGMSYEYTEHEKVKDKLCTKTLNGKERKGTYPGPKSSNLRFDMMVRNKKGQIAYGYASPLFVGDSFYAPFGKASMESKSSSQVNDGQSSRMNISYVMSFTKRADFDFGSEVKPSMVVEISAEGIYNTKTGVICMIGCRQMPFEKFQRNRSFDCELVVNINYLNGGMIHGTIESTREKSNPLYFDLLEFGSSSITTGQARESIWRMDLEITMVLISNTLTCIFIGFQLFHVKKYPEMLPFISIIMLIVLTLAHMIPLLLNFEAIFLKNQKQNVFLGTDQWLEVNEVLVRVITMVAFLLQFRLLQLAWSSRNSHESHNNLWDFDKKVLYLTFPLYVAGGLTAWFAHSWQNSYTKTRRWGPRQFRTHNFAPKSVTFWGELKSFVGLILDAFLIPQIMFNLFCDSRETVLDPLFYVGSVVVRLLPHAYDLYRTHSSSWFYDKIYANPGMDYYSTTWDVVICCGGVLCVTVVYVQQRYGGRCVLPERFRGRDLYEKVPVSSIEL